MPKHVAILGGGIAGLTAAYELTRLQLQGADITFSLVERSHRLGGTLETERRQTAAGEFVIELGPDGWVTEKPWARELAIELGLAAQLLPSNDAGRVTWVWHNGQLQPMPDGMRMMVPSNLHNVQNTPLINAEAYAAYAAEPGRAQELKQLAPSGDESIASFVRRHFGSEVLRTVGAPLLGGIFGGDVEQLSVRAVMQPFVNMEREHGSLILALQSKARERAHSAAVPAPAIFTSLSTGTGTLAEAMVATLDPRNVHFHHTAIGMTRVGSQWSVLVKSDSTEAAETLTADHVLLALPVLRARELLHPLDGGTQPLMYMQTSSAAVVAFGFMPDQNVHLPPGFGFLVPPDTPRGGGLLAGTFCDQKYAHRAPAGARLVRAYYGGLDVGANGDDLPPSAMRTLPYGNALADLRRILGPIPDPAFTVTRLWPHALPQYSVGHLERVAELDERVARIGNLHLLGNGYRGVGLPDLIRDAREAARSVAR